MATLGKAELEQLYVTQKYSVHDIAMKYRCSDQRINYWLFKHKIPKRSISEAIYIKRNPLGDPFKFQKPINKEEIFLFGLGLGLYWGEGTKKSNAVRLGNTDPRLIKKFVEFLVTIYCVPVSKFRFGLQIFSDMSKKEALQFWSNTLGVPKDRFLKVIRTPARGVGTYREKTKHGVLTIYVSNKKLRDLLCKEIENF